MRQPYLFVLFLAGMSAASTTLSGSDLSGMYKSLTTLAPRSRSASPSKEEAEHDLASMYGSLAVQPASSRVTDAVIAEEEYDFDGTPLQEMIDSVFLDAIDEDMLLNLVSKASHEAIIRKAGMLLEEGHRTIALAETLMGHTWGDKDDVVEDSQDGSDDSPADSDISQVSETDVESQEEDDIIDAVPDNVPDAVTDNVLDDVLDDVTAASKVCEDYKNGTIKHDAFNILGELQLDDDAIQDILAFYTQDIRNIVEREEGQDSEGLPEAFVVAFKNYANALALTKSLDPHLAPIQGALKEVSGEVDGADYLFRLVNLTWYLHQRLSTTE